MVERRTVEIPDPLPDEPLDEYVQRLSVAGDLSFGVPPPIIVPGPSAGPAGMHSIELKVTALGSGTQMYINRWRFNSTGSTGDMSIIAPLPPGSGTPIAVESGRPLWALRGYLGGNNPSSLWSADGGSNYPLDVRSEAARGIAMPYSIWLLSDDAFPAFTMFGMQNVWFGAGSYMPKTFTLAVDGADVLSVADAGWTTNSEWKWWSV